MRIYIAARFSRRPAAHALAKALAYRGHTITSRWVMPDADHVLPTGLSAQAADAERARFAHEDLADMYAADTCVSLMEEPRNDGRGGRHVEFGFMLAQGAAMVIIGPRETVFHHLPKVQHYPSVAAYLAELDA